MSSWCSPENLEICLQAENPLLTGYQARSNTAPVVTTTAPASQSTYMVTHLATPATCCRQLPKVSSNKACRLDPTQRMSDLQVSLTANRPSQAAVAPAKNADASAVF